MYQEEQVRGAEDHLLPQLMHILTGGNLTLRTHSWTASALVTSNVLCYCYNHILVLYRYISTLMLLML